MRLAAALVVAACTVAGTARADGPVLPNGAVVLQELDKITARVSKATAKLGEQLVFGTLGITPRACLTTPPTEAPESAAFLEIRDLRDGAQKMLFSGWMFASSPGLNALEDPIYDVWVVECAEPQFENTEPEPPPLDPVPSAKPQ
ncbi:MAG: DUF2155 domain-containing protein [Geminicoccaceae bacterium]